MAPGTWKMFNGAKLKLGQGSMLLSGAFRMALFTSASNLKTAASAKPLLTLASITGQIADGGGYSTSGKTLPNETWAVGADASSMRFAFTATGLKWSATAATIANIKYAAIFCSNATAGLNYPLCYVTLSTSQFTLANTNSLTVKPAATGIFNLTGM